MADSRSGADGAFLNAGGIRAEIDAGPITLQDALTVFPFGNSNVEMTFTGSQLWTIFEGIFSRVNQVNGRAVTSGIQVSKSFKIKYNNAQPEGKKLISMEIGGSPVEAEKVYTMVTLDFMATGGDNMWEARKDYTLLDTMDEVWAKYVEKVTPISQEIEGRLVETTETVQILPI